MRRLVSISVLVLSCICAGAQDQIAKELAGMLEGNIVRISYSYENAAGIPLGSGSATVQGSSYLVTEGNMRFFCDGASIWSVDSGSKEVYIEKAGGGSDLFGNVRNLLSRVQDLRYDGRKSVSFSLVPAENTERIFCKALVEDVRPAREELDFSFDTGKLDSSWVVTDLR